MEVTRPARRRYGRRSRASGARGPKDATSSLLCLRRLERPSRARTAATRLPP